MVKLVIIASLLDQATTPLLFLATKHFVATKYMKFRRIAKEKLQISFGSLEYEHYFEVISLNQRILWFVFNYCASDYVSNMGCAKGCSAVRDFVL